MKYFTMTPYENTEEGGYSCGVCKKTIVKMIHVEPPDMIPFRMCVHCAEKLVDLHNSEIPYGATVSYPIHE